MSYSSHIDPTAIILSTKEQALLVQLALAGEATVTELRDRLYAGREMGTDPTSWVRNTLRRPVRAGLVSFSGRGTPYRLTPAGEQLAARILTRAALAAQLGEAFEAMRAEGRAEVDAWVRLEDGRPQVATGRRPRGTWAHVTLDYRMSGSLAELAGDALAQLA